MLRPLLAVLLALAPALAAAQQQVTLERSAASRCLTSLRPGSEPEYPFAAFSNRKAGLVRVELTFNGPDAAPVLKVLEQTGDKDHVESFVDAVRAHARSLRVPCLRPEEGQAQLIQEFAFTPDQRLVVSMPAEDSLTKEQTRMLQCIAHKSGETKVEFPREAARQDIQGRVVVRLRFVAPDQAPQAEVYARRSARLLRNQVAHWVNGLRMPCHQGGPVTVTQTYVFLLGDSAYGFKPLILPQLLSAVRNIGKQTLAFDTTTMDCPFDLRLHYRRPFLPNLVGEVLERRPSGAPATGVDMPAAANPARRPLLDWLADVDFDLPEHSLDSIFGDTALVTVPCVKIDLKPKE